MSLKIDFLLYPGGALTIAPCKLRPTKFLRPGVGKGAHAPSAPPGLAYAASKSCLACT